jgi:hypothetical protein
MYMNVDCLTCQLYYLKPRYEEDWRIPDEASQPDDYNHLVGVKLCLPATGFQWTADGKISLERYSY